MPPMPPMLLMLPSAAWVITRWLHTSPIPAELEISLLKWWSLQAFVDT